VHFLLQASFDVQPAGNHPCVAAGSVSAEEHVAQLEELEEKHRVKVPSSG
jgi:hypothetical protein